MKTQKKRNYFTVREFMDRTLDLAKQDEKYPELEEACALDYQMVSHGTDDKQLKRMDFDVIGFPEYGTSEGIYSFLCVRGEWLPSEEQHIYGQTMPVYTLKTLREGKDAYIAMGAMATLLCYYANKVIADNMDRFD